MKRILKLVFLISAGAFLISTTALYVVNAGLRKQQNDSFYTLNTIQYNADKYDLLMIGNSRCKNNLDPKIIDSIAGLQSFNTGNYNFTITECKLLLELYLSSSHPVPHTILLTIDNKMLNTDQEFYFPQQFLPYVHNDLIYNTLKEYSNDYFTVRYLPFIGITKYNDYMKYLSLKAFVDPRPTDSRFYKGYLPMTGGNAMREANRQAAEIQPTTKGLQLLKDFFEIAGKKNIRVFVVYPPFYNDPDAEEVNRFSAEFYSKVNGIISGYDNIKTLDMTHASLSHDKTLFFDKGHLNEKGAGIFSAMIADSLKKDRESK